MFLSNIMQKMSKSQSQTARTVPAAFSQIPPQPFLLPLSRLAAGTPRLDRWHRSRLVVLERDLVVVQVQILSLAAAHVHIQLFIVEMRLSLCLRNLCYLHFHISWVFCNWIWLANGITFPIFQSLSRISRALCPNWWLVKFLIDFRLHSKHTFVIFGWNHAHS